MVGLLRTISLRQRVHRLLEPATAGDRASRIFDICLLSLIALNILATVLGTVDAISVRFGRALRVFETVSVMVFTVEYLLRLWSAPEDHRYAGRLRGRVRLAATPLALIDLAAIVPFYLVLVFPAAVVLDLRFPRAIRLMRVFRLFKIGRYSASMKTMARVLRRKKEELGITAFIVVVLLILASSLMYFAEHEAQPGIFSSIPAAMWWGVETLTTVGYGDAVPTTALGKVLGMIISILGIGLFALPAGILGSGFIQEIQESRQSPGTCPHCGREIGSP